MGPPGQSTLRQSRGCQPPHAQTGSLNECTHRARGAVQRVSPVTCSCFAGVCSLARPLALHLSGGTDRLCVADCTGLCEPEMRQSLQKPSGKVCICKASTAAGPFPAKAVCWGRAKDVTPSALTLLSHRVCSSPSSHVVGKGVHQAMGQCSGIQTHRKTGGKPSCYSQTHQDRHCRDRSPHQRGHIPAGSEAPGALNPGRGREGADPKPYRIPSAPWSVRAVSLAQSDLTREALIRATDLANKEAQES